MPLLVLAAAVLLAYSNGANDSFKGVSTLFGSGIADYRWAPAWAIATTFAGSMLALSLAGDLANTFRGSGLVSDAVAVQPTFVLAVSLGAALTVSFATWAGLPVSTTHALTGALIGAGLMAGGGQIVLESLLSSFVLPLLLARCWRYC